MQVAKRIQLERNETGEKDEAGMELRTSSFLWAISKPSTSAPGVCGGLSWGSEISDAGRGVFSKVAASVTSIAS